MAGVSGSGGSGGCQRLELEPGETDAQGVTLIAKWNIAASIGGLGFFEGYLYLRGSPELGDLRLIRVSLTSDAVEVLDALPSFTTILRGDNLIWHEANIPDVSMGELKTAKLSNVAEASVLASVRTMLTLDADTENVYFGVSEPDEVYAVPRGGGAPVQLVDGARTGELVPFGGYLFYFDLSAQELRRVPAGGGEPETLVSVFDPGSAVVDADGVYWVEGFDREIRHFALGADASTVFLSELDDEPTLLTLNGDDVLWFEGTLCSAVYHPNEGGTATELMASGFEVPTWMGVHEGRLYVTDREGVYRLDL